MLGGRGHRNLAQLLAYTAARRPRGRDCRQWCAASRVPHGFVPCCPALLRRMTVQWVTRDAAEPAVMWGEFRSGGCGDGAGLASCA